MPTISWVLPMAYNVGEKTLGVGVVKEFVGVVLISDGVPADVGTMSAKELSRQC